MPFIETSDRTRIFYKDEGAGQPIVFSHGWPLTADAWEGQLYFFASNGFRAIAHDRRGNGRSDQPWQGNDIDTFADDLAALLDALDLEDAVLVGHSTGGGEIARYIGRHGTGRVARAVFISSIVPQAMQTPDNPDGAPPAAFEGLRQGMKADRAQLYHDLADGPFFGANRPGAKVSQGARDDFWRMGMQGGLKGQHDTSFSWEVDYTPDLRRMTKPALVIHGDDDQIVPFKAAGARSVKILPDAELKVYEGGPHGLPVTHADRVNADILAFLRR